MRLKQGFTLVEILVVLIIISITLGFALVAFGDFGASRHALVAAEQFASYLKLVQRQAIIEGTSLAIEIDKEGYRTYRFAQQKIWQPMNERSIFHWRSFPDNLVIDLQKTLKNNKSRPQIIIHASGELTAFKLNFGTTNKPNLATLIGEHKGEVFLNLKNHEKR